MYIYFNFDHTVQLGGSKKHLASIADVFFWGANKDLPKGQSLTMTSSGFKWPTRGVAGCGLPGDEGEAKIRSNKMSRLVEDGKFRESIDWDAPTLRIPVGSKECKR